METMHFHKANTNLFFRTIMRNCPKMGARQAKLDVSEAVKVSLQNERKTRICFGGWGKSMPFVEYKDQFSISKEVYDG